jgi:hypothetical protein
MAEESLKGELRAALPPRPLRQPRHLLTGPAMEAEDEKNPPSRAQAGTVYPSLPTTLRARSRIATSRPLRLTTDADDLCRHGAVSSF